MSPQLVHELAQKLIDRLEQEVQNNQARIEGIAMLYKAIAEADVRNHGKEEETSET